MAGARIHYSFNGRAAQEAVTRLGIVRPGTMRAIGMALVATTDARFQSQTEPFGAKWAPLNPAYAQIKRGTRILTASGLLARSITSQVHGHQVVVGSNRVYAAIHQFGGKITAKTPKGLAIRMGGFGANGTGRGWVHVRSVVIPARPYLGFGPADERAVLEVLGRAWRDAQAV